MQEFFNNQIKIDLWMSSQCYDNLSYSYNKIQTWKRIHKENWTLVYLTIHVWSYRWKSIWKRTEV